MAMGAVTTNMSNFSKSRPSKLENYANLMNKILQIGQTAAGLANFSGTSNTGGDWKGTSPSTQDMMSKFAKMRSQSFAPTPTYQGYSLGVPAIDGKVKR